MANSGYRRTPSLPSPTTRERGCGGNIHAQTHSPDRPGPLSGSGRSIGYSVLSWRADVFPALAGAAIWVLVLESK
jgi:hypothetical protein